MLNFLVGYPSGQRGQTVNLLAMPSVVRIHPRPNKSSPKGLLFLLVCLMVNSKSQNQYLDDIAYLKRLIKSPKAVILKLLNTVDIQS